MFQLARHASTSNTVLLRDDSTSACASLTGTYTVGNLGTTNTSLRPILIPDIEPDEWDIAMALAAKVGAYGEGVLLDEYARAKGLNPNELRRSSRLKPSIHRH